MDSSNWVSSIANVVIALGVILVWYQAILLRRQTKADHERSPGEFTIRLMQQWNVAISPLTSVASKVANKLSDEQCRELAGYRPFEADSKLLEHEFQFFVQPEKGMDAFSRFPTALGGKDAFPAIEDFVCHIKQKNRKVARIPKSPSAANQGMNWKRLSPLELCPDR